ncbi:hypothetical protein PA01_00280 [Azoarcus sp. PA01]|nr:hypothetical protein PA01_19530 [Azoarcus sp. PA01]KON82522.1 hypothetical protein PA01_00280 [Azoarcus sp. PA01]
MNTKLVSSIGDVARSRLVIVGVDALLTELGGLMKRGSGFVIAALTKAILGPQRHGREHGCAWQKAVFGKSRASSALARYSETGRSGGGCGTPLMVPEAVEQTAKALFARYVQRFKALASLRYGYAI